MLRWLEAAEPAARAVVDTAPVTDRECDGTWFVGVDALANDAAGAVNGSGPLEGAAMAFLRDLLGAKMPPLHPAQLSAIYPGYPRPRAGESEAAFGYRQRRDAAHVDGLLAVGEDRRRMLKEPHAFVLGLPIDACTAETSPLVVWEGSHHIMRAAFERALADCSPDHWAEVDLTDIYKAARREVFETCARVQILAGRGEAILLHRHLLHGIAPWTGKTASPHGRLVAYFRPQFPQGSADWLRKP
ncbi:hypothetical protein [Aliiroseovarius sp. YM-037]|uniref:hypothetical protein n=1 Tax=Aliiroseovarius sp. YM-037 TaxID=3341728 RepID=UPI003A80ED5B